MHRRIARIELESVGALSATARATLRELLVRGPLHRAELSRLLGLSAASLTKATQELLEYGYIAESSAVRGITRGRPGAPLSLAPGRIQFIGAKVTADAVFAVRVDALGTVLDSRHHNLEATEVDTVRAVIVQLVNEMAHDNPVQAVGIGTAGQMSRFDDHVRQNEYLGWDLVPLAAMVESECDVPTIISADVRALTAGVQWWGPGRAWHDFAVVTIGVGVGLCAVVEGRALAGPHGGASLVEHLRIGDSGGLCELGHRGCVSAFLTTAAITHAVTAVHGEPVTLAGVCALADGGDPVAQRVLADAGRALGAVIANAANLFDLQGVVVTGDGLPIMAHAMATMTAELTERLDRKAHLPQLELLDSDFDEWARGAALVACQWLLLEPPATDRLGTVAAVEPSRTA